MFSTQNKIGLVLLASPFIGVLTFLFYYQPWVMLGTCVGVLWILVVLYLLDYD